MKIFHLFLKLSLDFTINLEAFIPNKSEKYRIVILNKRDNNDIFIKKKTWNNNCLNYST